MLAVAVVVGELFDVVDGDDIDSIPVILSASLPRSSPTVAPWPSRSPRVTRNLVPREVITLTLNIIF